MKQTKPETALETFLAACHRNMLEAYVAAHPDCIDEALQLMLSEKKPYSWRAAWLLFHCMADDDERIKKHLKTLIGILPRVADGEQREWLKILYRMQPDETLEAALFDQAIAIWQQMHKIPSVRVNALKIIVKTVLRYPDMQQELAELTQAQYLAKLSVPMKKSVALLLRQANKKLELQKKV